MKLSTLWFAIAISIICFNASGHAQGSQVKKMKIYISADMEGVVGVVTQEQLGPADLNISALVNS